MTLEDVKELANRGNVNAMMALAETYLSTENEKDRETAFHYYELAAEAGNLNACLKMAQVSELTANAVFAMTDTLGHGGDTLRYLEKAYHWASLLEGSVRSMRKSGLQDNHYDYIRDKLIVAISRLATFYYMEKRYDDIVNITKDVDHPYAKAVCGLALFEIAESDDEVGRTFPFLKHIENDACWKEDFQSTKYSQILPVLAASNLSTIYRVLKGNTDASYAALKKIVDFSRSEELRKNAQEDLDNHYRKKMFGGYSWVG